MFWQHTFSPHPTISYLKPLQQPGIRPHPIWLWGVSSCSTRWTLPATSTTTGPPWEEPPRDPSRPTAAGRRWGFEPSTHPRKDFILFFCWRRFNWFSRQLQHKQTCFIKFSKIYIWFMFSELSRVKYFKQPKSCRGNFTLITECLCLCLIRRTSD